MMTRFLAVWLPNWPIHRLVVEQPELSNKPIVLHARDSRQRQIVAACSSKAQSMGVRTDMPLADATAIVEGEQFVLQSHDTTADQEALAFLAKWCSQFSPLVAIDLPDSLYLDLDGVTHLYGDESALVNCVVKAFRAKGYRPRLAIADTPSAAWAAAHYAKTSLTIVPRADVQTLFELPVAALRLPDATLEKLDRLGIHRVKQLIDLPRKSLPSRIGQEVIERLDYLTGDKSENICGYKPPLVFEQQWPLEHATAHWETIKHVVRVLLERLAKQLHRHSHGANRLTICLDCTNNQPVKIRIGLYRASADARRFDELAQLQMETTRLLAAVECVTVMADETEPLEQQQNSLLATEHHVDARELADLVERLSSRLSDECVVRAKAVDDWQPEQAFSYQPLTQASASPIITRRVSEGRKQSLSPPTKSDATYVETTRLDSPEGTTASRLGRQPQVSKGKIVSSPEGATQQTGSFPVAPSGLCGGIRSQSPGADAPGYMPSPLRGWERASAKNASEADPSLTLRVEMREDKGVGSLFWKNELPSGMSFAEKDSRPLCMFFPPKPIEVVAEFPDGPPARFYFHGEQRLANCWGPERLEIAWWRGASVRRDYYRVETESARRFWLFRRLNDGKWFLHGSFD